MISPVMLKGIIIGVEDLGGKFYKIESDKIYFFILKNSKMDTEIAINKTKDVLKDLFGLKLFIKKIDNLEFI